MQRVVLLVLVMALLVPTAVWSQTSSSTVRGSVRDQTEAAIPAANVTLTNSATNVARETQSNASGLFVFPGVTPGNYRITVEYPGLQTFEGTLNVQVQQDATVPITLQVATEVTTVDVIDVTPLVQTDSASLGQVVERQRIEQLPKNGRGYQNLLVTVPGITWRTHGHQIGGRLHGYGLATGTNMLVFDGSSLTTANMWDVARTPSLDAVQEIKVEVNASSAKYARPTTVVMSSRSGTNQYHGSVFALNRNSGLGQARRREDGNEKPAYVNRNEYGASLGGPIIRDRTFFFYAFEGTRFLRQLTFRSAVPTAEVRAGDFRGLEDSRGRAYTLYDPFTTNPETWERQPLAYLGVPNMINPSSISRPAEVLFGVTKLPTNPEINPLADDNWLGYFNRPLWQEAHSLRIDHRISDSDLIYGRYSYGYHEEHLTSRQTLFDPLPCSPESGRCPSEGVMPTIAGNYRPWPSHTISTTWVHTFSPTMTNELLVNGMRDDHQRGGGDFVSNYARDLMGLPNPFDAVNVPRLDSLGYGSFSTSGDGPYQLISTQLSIQTNATRVAGNHELQFGLHYRLEDTPRNVDPTAGGFSAGTSATSLYDPDSNPSSPESIPRSGHNMANLYLGILNYQATSSRPWAFFRRHEWAPYFQDNWKITPRLTLNLGVRWEYRTPIWDRNEMLTSFDLDQRAYVTAASVDRFVELGGTLPAVLDKFREFGGNVISYQDAGLPKSLVNSDWAKFGPRVGFAYRAGRGLVLRGGYRMTYYPDPTDSANSVTLSRTTFQRSVSNTSLSPDGLPDYGLRSVPEYIAGVNTDDSIIDITDTRLVSRGFSATRIDPNIREPRVQDWNFTIEKEVMSNTVARVGYVGNHVDRMPQTLELNESIPSYIWYESRREPLPTGEFAGVARRPYDQQVYGGIDLIRDTGYSNYHGMQLEIERRYNNGFGFQIFYNLANTLEASGTIPSTTDFLPGTVPADIDERNTFLNYLRDDTAPQHQIRWNWIVDLPFGRGKRLGGNATGFLQKLIGGWQISGVGNWRTTYWGLPDDVYPSSADSVEIYDYQYPISDCRSGECFTGYLFWNGYIPSHQINSFDEDGNPNGVMGVPASYRPAGEYLIPWGSTALPPNAPPGTDIEDRWDTNNVWIPLNDGTVQRTGYNNGLHPWRNQLVTGVRQWFQDVSLLKSVNLTERVGMSFSVDFFNAFNHPNNDNPDDDGILLTRDSANDARQMQLSLRLTW